MKKKSSLKNKFLTLAVLTTVMGGSVFMPRAEAAMNWTLAAPTGSTYKNSIVETTVSQATKDGDITLGNQINFGTYQQSLKTGSFSAPSTGPITGMGNHDATYSADFATFNRDPVAWIVVKDNGSNKYTLVSTKVLDGGVKWTDGSGKIWSSSSMRTWMNDTMYNRLVEGMSAAQKGLIQESTITTYQATSSAGWDNSTTVLCTTEDKLYLMSMQELKGWFAGSSGTNPDTTAYPGGSSASGKVPWGAGATDYAKSKGMYIEREGGVTAVDGSLNANYYLRSPASNYALNVRGTNTSGAVYSYAKTYLIFGSRPAMQIDLSSLPLIFTSKSSYDYHYGTAGESKFTAGKGSAELGGAAAKFETISAGSAGTPGDVLDLTLYDSSLGAPNVTTNTSLELNGANMKLGYSGASTAYKTAGMLATGDATSGYAPEGWALLSNKTGTGDMVVGLANMDAGREYQLLMFNEQGDGTSFIGNAAYAFDGFKKNSGGKFELDLTTTNNAGKTFSGAITIGTGNKLTAKASQLTGGTTVTSTNDGTIVLKDGGTISFAINESASADGTLILDLGSASNKTLVFNGSTIANKVLVKNGSSLDPSANVFTDTVYLEDNAKLYLETGTLAVDILKATSGTAGATATATTGGTTYLKADASATTPAYQVITVNSDRKIEGTLDGSGSTIKMTGDNAVKTLTIDTLTGTTNLEIDVDMSNFTADKLAVGTITGATVNVSGINITKDITLTTLELPKEENSKITFVSDQAGTGAVGSGGTYQVNGSADGQIVLTNDFKYTFSKGTENGKLKYRAEAGDLTFKKFVEGTLPGYTTDPATLSMTADVANTGAGSNAVIMGSDQFNDAITVNLNGHNLTSAAASTITINSGKTFNLKGGNATTDGTVDANTGFSVAGTMNISGKTTINGNITNTGMVTFADITTAAGTLSGTGSYTNSGTLNIADASKLQMTGTNGLANTGTLNLGNATSSELGANITGVGITNIKGTVTSAKTIANKVTVESGKSFTTTGTVSGAVTNSGTFQVNGGLTSGSVTNNLTMNVTGGSVTGGISNATAGTLTVSGGEVSTNAVTNDNIMNVTGGIVSSAVTNNKILTLNGTGEISGAVTNAADGTYTVTNGTQSGAVTNSGTFQVEGGLTSGSVTNNLTMNVTGGSVTGGISNATAGTLTVSDGEVSTNAVTNDGIMEVTNGSVSSAVTNNKTLTLNGTGEISGAVTNVTGGTYTVTNGTQSGTVTNNGTFQVNGGIVKLVTNTGTMNVTNVAALTEDITNTNGTVNFNSDGTLASGSTITGGTVNITGDVTANASDIAGDANTIDAGKTLTLNGGTLGGNLSGAGNVTIGNGTDNATVTAALTKFGNTGDLTVADKGTLMTGGELNRDIKGTGTVQLNADSTLSNGKKIDGTLDGNGKNVTIGTANSIDSFTLGKLAGTTNLTLDVDMGNFTADKLAVGTITGATVNVSGINITKDIVLTDNTLTLPQSGENAITYVTDSSGGTAGNATYQVGGAADGTVVVTNNYKYTFSKGTENGKLAYRVDASDLTFKKFMEGTLGSPSPTTLSLTGDLQNLGDGIASISQGPNSITINLNGHELGSASASNITVGSGKTLNLKGGNATTDGTVDGNTNFSVAGTMNISGKTTINGNITNTGTVTFAGATTAAGTLGGAGSYTNSGTLNIADASKLQMTNGLTNSGTLNLGGGTLGADITGDGITNINGVVNSEKDIANSVEVASTGYSTGYFTVSGGNVIGKVTNRGNFHVSGGVVAMVDNKGNMTVTGLESVTGEITNSGTLYIGGGALKGQNITNTGGTIGLSGHYTLDWANAVSGLVIDGGSVNSGDSTLTLTGMTKENKDNRVKLLNLTNGATATGSWAGLQEGVVYDVKRDITGIIDANNRLRTFTIENGYFSVLSYGSNFVPMDSSDDGIRTTAYNVANAMAESADSNITTFIDGITDMADTAAASDALNASMNIGEAGGVQHGAVSMAGLIGEAIGSNMSISTRPILSGGQQAAMRNVANEGDAKGAKIEEIEVAKASEIMPVAYQEQKYEKTIWASYMHNKEDINGLQMDGVKQNGTAQYNGTTVGADLWSSNKVIGGVAIAYSTGDVNSVIDQVSTKNEAKYYGVSVYNRWTNGSTGILADVGYMHSKNELTQHNTGSELTADAKINSFTAGVRAEQLVKMGRSNLVPFAGVRYMHLRNGEYTLSVDGGDGQHFAPKNQNIITPQVGVGWNGEYKIEGSKWTFRPSVEVGYLWNLGDRDTESIVSFGGANDTIGYEVADKSSYYAKLGVEFKKDNVTLGVSFKYQKGDAVKNRKWNFNMSFTF